MAKAIGFNQVLQPLDQVPQEEPKPKVKAVGFDTSKPSGPAPLEGPTPSAQYTKGYLAGQDLKDYIAYQQDGWDQFGNFVGQTAIGALTGTVEAASYLGDLQQHWNLMKGQEEEFTNIVAETMQEAKEKFKDSFPVYLSNENETFQPLSAEWWAHNGGEGLGTTLSLLVPGLAVGKAGKVLGLGKTGQALSATVASRYAESTMEANQVFEQSYNELIAQGIPDEEAKARAGDAATTTWKTNWVFAAQDFMQFNALTKGFKSTAKGGVGKSIGEFLMQPISEGAEEAGQYIVSEEAKRIAKDTSAEYFGDDLSKRLEDYIQDDEFKTSVLLGAAGGAVFAGAGKLADIPLEKITELVKNKAVATAKRGLGKERANYIDDTATSQKITDIDFAQQYIDKFNQGKLSTYKGELEELKKQPNIDADARTSIDNYINDVDSLLTEEARLKSSAIPADVHKPILLRKMQQQQAIRAEKKLTQEVDNIYQKMMADKLMEPTMLELRKKKAQAEASAILASKNPKITQLQKLASEAAAEYAAQLEMTKIANPKFNEASLIKSDELDLKTRQLLSNQLNKSILQGEIDALMLPSGQAAHRAKQNVKKEAEKVAVATANPATTIDDLTKIKADTGNPVLIDQLDKAIASRKADVMESNKVDIAENIKQEVPPPPTIADIPVDKLADVPDTYIDPSNAFSDVDPSVASKFGVFVPEPQPITSKVNLDEKQPGPNTLKAKQAAQKEVQQMSYLEKETTKTWLKRYKGEWKGNEFVYERDQTGEYVLQPYTNNASPTKETKPANQVFAATEQGLLLVDTPLIKEGDKVLCIIENEFPYTLTPGFKPNGRANQVVNVYLVDESGNKLHGKPLLQLDSADNKRLTQAQQQNNISLRNAIHNNGGQIITTIIGKNVGAVRRANRQNSLAVLEHDFYQGSIQKTPFDPILGVVDVNGNMIFENLSKVPGEYQGMIKDIGLNITTDLSHLKGSIVTVRMSPKGDLHIEALTTRNLTNQEAAWIAKNYDQLDGTALRDLVYLPKATQADFKKWGEAQRYQYLTQAYRNINPKRLNTSLPFTDVVTGQQYPTYYEFLKQTEALTTKLKGSIQQGTSGEDNSYSFAQATIYLDPKPNVNTITVQDEKITATPIPPVQTPPATTEAKTSSDKEKIAAIKKRAKLKPATHDSVPFKAITQTELDWMKNHWGEEFFEVARNLDRFIANNGRQAFGQYYDGLVTIAEFAPEGTGYHEFFHFFMDPINGLISQTQKDNLLQKFTEEQLAVEFEKYKLSNGRYKSPSPRADSFFAKLLNMIKKLLGLKTPLERLFAKVDGTVLTQEQKNRIVTNKKLLGDITPASFKLAPGFLSYAHQADAINTITSNIVDSAYLAAQQEGVNISDIIGTQAKLDALFKAQLDYFIEDFKRIANETNRTENDIERFMAYHAMGIHDFVTIPTEQEYEEFKGTWEDDKSGEFVVEGFKTKVLNSFNRFGFNKRTRSIEEADPDEDGDSESTEAYEIKAADEVERIFDKNTTLTNPRQSISQSLRLWLHSIPVPVVDANNNVIGSEKTIFGTERRLDFSAVDRKLSIKLADSVDPELVLSEMAEVDPIAKVVYSALQDLKAKNNTLYTEFYVKYRRNTTVGKTILEKTTETADSYSPDVRIDHDLRVIDSNRDSVFRAQLLEWRDKGIRKKAIDLNDEPNTTLFDRLRQELANLEAANQTAIRTKSPLTYNKLKTSFNAILSELGVSLPTEFWTSFEATKATDDRGKQRAERKRTAQLRAWLFNAKADSIAELLKATSPIYEGGILEVLAKKSAPFYKGSDGVTYIAEDGTQRFPINLGSFITDWANMIKESGTEFAQNLQRDGFYKDNQLLELLKDEGTRDSIQVVEIEAIRSQDADAKMFEDRTTMDSIRTRLAAFFVNKNTDTSTGYFLLPTPADKSKNPAIKLPKFKGQDAYNFLKKVLNQTIQSEAVRIQNLRNSAGQDHVDTALPTDVKNLAGASKFVYVTEINENPVLARILSADLSKGEASASEYKTALAEAEIIVEKHIDQNFSNFLSFLVDENIIGIETTPDGQKLVNKNLPKGFFNGNGTSAQIEALLKEFFYNDTAWNLEMSKVFMGDRALYKSDDDYFKRAYQLVTPGYVGFEETPTYVTRGVYTAQLKKNNPDWLKAINSKYGEVNKTDAQTIATIGGYRKLAKSLGQWDKIAEQAFQIAWSKGLTLKQGIKAEVANGRMTEEDAKKLRSAKINLRPLKPFQFNDVELHLPDGKVMFIKEQVKDSITPIIPEMIITNNPGHQGYKQLISYMEANGLDLMSAEDTIKVGSYGILDLTRPPEPWEIRTTPISNIRYPQLLPNKTKEETKGSQFHKLILGNLDSEGDYVVDGKTIKGKTVRERYNNLWAEKLENASKELQSRLGVGPSYQFSSNPKEFKAQMLKLQDFLKEELASRDLDENYIDTLTLVRQTIDKIDFSVPLSFPQFGDKFQGILTNIFKRDIIKQKSPGYVAVNLADFGVGHSDELKFMAKDEETGEYYSEIGLSINYVNDIGLEYGKHIAPNGRILWKELSKEQKKALEFIAYRIPTSSKSSMLPVRISLILPSYLNSVVMIPGELTVQMGLDFDVDKTQLLRRVLDKENKIDKDNVDNKLFELYWGILNSPQHLKELLTPLTTDVLEAIREDYEKRGLFNQTKFPVYMMPTNVRMESKNKEEKAKVGIASRASTAHSVLQNIKEESRPIVEFFITYKEARGYRLGNTLDMDGTLISNNLDQIQQAALDAAKNPLLALFNITKNYTALAESMVMAGYPLKVVTDFFMQPIIREYMKVYNQNNQIESVALDKLLDSNPAVKEFYTDMPVPVLSAEELEANLNNNEDPLHSANVLKQFVLAAQQARMMSTLTDVLSIDTLNDLSSIESIQSLRHKIQRLVANKDGITFPGSLLTLETAPVETKRLAAFIKYGIKDALAFVKQFYPSADYSKHHEFIAQQLGLNPITDVPTLKAINQFINFYQMEQSGTLGKALKESHPLYNDNSALDKSHHSHRWSFADPKRTIYNYIEKVIKEVNNEALTNNLLITNLRVKPNKNGITLIGLNNTGTDKNKTDIINAFDELLNAEDVRVRTLAHDLAKYAIYTSGFSYTTASFVNTIPVSFFVNNGLGEWWRTKIATNSFEIDENTMMLNLVRNKADKLKGFPSISNYAFKKNVSSVVRNKQKVVTSFQMKKDVLNKMKRVPNYILYNDNVYEQSPNKAGEYALLQKAGERFYVEVSADGRKPSVITKNVGSPDPFNMQSGTVTSSHSLEDADSRDTDANPYITDYVSDNSTVPSVLEQLISEETIPEQKVLLEKLLSNASKINTNFQVTEMPGKFGVFVVTDTGTGVESTIKINPYSSVTTKEFTRRVLLHEILHAYTVGVLQNPSTQTEATFNMNVERLVSDARAKLGNVQGTQNKFEFIAELAGNPDFRSKLRGKGLWARIIRQIRKLFGVPDAYDQLIDELYSVLDKAAKLDKYNPSEHNLEEPKKPSKFTSSMDKMLTSLNAELRTLKERGNRKKKEATNLKKEIVMLEKLRENNELSAMVRYFMYVDSQLKTIEKERIGILKNKGNYNPETVARLRNQILSYNDLLDQFYEELKDKELPAEINKKIMMDQARELRAAIHSMSLDFQAIARERVFQVTTKTLNLNQEEQDQLKGDLKIADRDISIWSRMTRSGIEMSDKVIQAMTTKLQNVFRKAYRDLQGLIYAEAPSTQTAVFTVLTIQKDAAGVVKVSDETGEPFTSWVNHKFTYTRVNKMKALEEYNQWRGKASTLADKYAPILDPKSFDRSKSKGISFIDPLSPRGKEILAIKPGSKDYPLRQFYENFVLDYIKSQEEIKLPSQRPGLRIPTIGKSLLEGFVDAKSIGGFASFSKQKFLDNFIEKSDEQEFQRVNQHLQPSSTIPLRFTAQQDGKNGRYSIDQVSLDVPSTVLMFQHEMFKRGGLQEIQDDLELARDILGEREVIVTKPTSYTDLLSGEESGQQLEGGGYQVIEGAASKAYQAMRDIVDRDLYGRRKKAQKAGRIVDFIAKVSGMNIMLGNVAIPITNMFMGNYALFTEAVGGNIISMTNLKNGYKLYTKNITAYGKDFGKKASVSEFGKLMAFFNPLDKLRPTTSLSINGEFLRDSWHTFISTGANVVEQELAVVTMGSVMDRFKVQGPDGDVAFNEGITISPEGKLTLKSGYTYKGKKTISNEEIDKILQYTIRLFHLTSGVYNQMDEGLINRDFVGRLVTFMRKWLPAGLDARFRRQYKDERLGITNEGQYISALIAFRQIFADNGYIDGTLKSIRLLLWAGTANPKALLLPNELQLPEEEQQELISLRKANIKKTLFQLYTVAALSLLLLAGDDDEDSYAQYLIARVRREMMTFMSPTTAWEVLRSPTVVMNTIQNLRTATYSVGEAAWDATLGDGVVDIKQRGKGKGMPKWLYDTGRLVGASSLYQFDDLDTSTRLIQDGAFR